MFQFTADPDFRLLDDLGRYEWIFQTLSPILCRHRPSWCQVQSSPSSIACSSRICANDARLFWYVEVDVTMRLEWTQGEWTCSPPVRALRRAPTQASCNKGTAPRTDCFADSWKQAKENVRKRVRFLGGACWRLLVALCAPALLGLRGLWFTWLLLFFFEATTQGPITFLLDRFPVRSGLCGRGLRVLAPRTCNIVCSSKPCVIELARHRPLHKNDLAGLSCREQLVREPVSLLCESDHMHHSEVRG